jgi:hypothetical protein
MPSTSMVISVGVTGGSLTAMALSLMRAFAPVLSA